MPSEMDFPAKGKVTSVNGDTVTFAPTGTTYEVQLKAANGAWTGAINKPVEAIIRIKARKLMTVPSGGNFLTPIFGPPKIVQGRVRYMTSDILVLHAGVDILVDLPANDSAFDLSSGPVTMGSMVNATVFPGATIDSLTRVEVSTAK